MKWPCLFSTNLILTLFLSGLYDFLKGTDSYLSLSFLFFFFFFTCFGLLSSAFSSYFYISRLSSRGFFCFLFSFLRGRWGIVSAVPNGRSDPRTLYRQEEKTHKKKAKLNWNELLNVHPLASVAFLRIHWMWTFFFCFVRPFLPFILLYNFRRDWSNV